MLTNQLITALRPMIGFRKLDLVDQESYNDLSDDLTITTTGLTVDQCHELLVLPTLESAFPNNLNNFPAYLARTRDDAILSLLTSIDGRLSEAQLSPRLLVPTQLLPLIRVAPAMNHNPGRWAGFRLRVLTDDVSLTLERIGLSVNGTITLNFELFEEVLAPENATDNVGEVSVTGNYNGHWQDVTLPVLQMGKTYLLLYRQDDLGEVKAYNTFTGWPKASGCQGCKGRCWSKYLNVESVEVYENGQVVTTYGTNWGINLIVSAVGDVSGRLVMDPKRLIPVLKQQMAMSFLEKIAYSTRKNPETEDAIQGALFALTDKNNANRVPVLFDRAMSSLIKSMQAEASPALDVDDSDDVTWTSI